MMTLTIVLICAALIVAASVWVGMAEEKKKANRNSPQGQRARKQFDMAKAAGALPNRKEN